MIKLKIYNQKPDGKIVLHEVRVLILNFSYIIFSLNIPINYVLVEKKACEALRSKNGF